MNNIIEEFTAPIAAERRFKLVRFDQIKLAQDRNYLIKGLLPRDGLVVVWGPPKCGKSFWTFDAMYHIATGWEYRGCKVQQGTVVYVACEGERGLGARAAAIRQQSDTAAAAPFYLLTTRLDLVEDHAALIEDIRAQTPEPPAAVVIDTLNRSIQGSESRDEDMGRFIKAADAIRETFKCAVIVVHHCGIESSRPRGHTSLSGAVDAQIAVRRDHGERIACRVELMKDGPEGAEVHSTLRAVEVGQDQDGDPITSCLVEPAEAAPRQERGPRLTKNQISMLTILTDAMPGGLTVEDWNAQAREAGIGTKRRTDLMDLRSALKRKGQVHEYAGTWFATTR